MQVSGDSDIPAAERAAPAGDAGRSTSSGPALLARRHDVDWVRVLALGLLIVFHVTVSFQGWAASTGFPQNDEPLEGLLPFIALVTVWRIPILFLVSGMGVRFAMERRDWKQLLTDRTLRVLVPFLFGTYVLGAAFGALLPHVGWQAEYTLQFGHLWFLLNIYLYVLWLIGVLVYLKNAPDNAFLRSVSKAVRWPVGLFLLGLPLVIEAWLLDPTYFALYVDTAHGWLLGLICFFLGFLFVSVQEAFWPAVVRLRWVALAVAAALYLVRLVVFDLQGSPNGLTALESMSWMMAVLGFAAVHLNRPSRSLSYLSGAVYPVYIVHMPVQFVLAYFLLPRAMPAEAKLALLLVGTLGVSLVLYEAVLRRAKWIRPLFGMKLNPV